MARKSSELPIDGGAHALRLDPIVARRIHTGCSNESLIHVLRGCLDRTVGIWAQDLSQWDMAHRRGLKGAAGLGFW